MVSVIVPTRNRSYLLKRMLSSLLKQTLADTEYEVIVVDNGSTDDTCKVVDDFRSRITNLAYIYDKEPGLHVGRHRGMYASNTDQLVFADDDISALPTWLQAISDNFKTSSVAMIGGNNYPDFMGEVPNWLSKLWMRPMYGGKAISYLSILELPEGRYEINPFLVWGCNFSIRKQVLLDAGGFHPDSMPKELIQLRGDGETSVSRYVQKQGLQCIFDSRASVLHAVTPERMTLEYFRQRAFNQGISDSYTNIRCGIELKKRSYLVKITKGMFRIFRSWLRTVYNRVRNRSDPELDKVARVLNSGYKKGYEYHQRLCSKDQELQAWVMKSNYYAKL